MSTDRIVLPRPFDLHVHLRDLAILLSHTHYISSIFKAAIIMPNLVEVLDRPVDVLAYYQRILGALGEDKTRFQPVPTLYATPEMTPDVVQDAHDRGVKRIKFYPYGQTTHAHRGIADYDTLYPSFERMQKLGMYALFHAEVPQIPRWERVWLIDKERVFIEKILAQIVKDFLDLFIVIEHLSCREGVQFVFSCGHRVAATLSAIHLALTTNDQYGQPFNVCQPCAKDFKDQDALRFAATSGEPKFGYGSDSAPHDPAKKLAAKNASGIFVPGEVGVPLVAEIFEQRGALERLPGFLTSMATGFYDLTPPADDDTLTLVRNPWTVPAEYQGLVPLWAGQVLQWQVKQG